MEHVPLDQLENLSQIVLVFFYFYLVFPKKNSFGTSSVPSVSELGQVYLVLPNFTRVLLRFSLV